MKITLDISRLVEEGKVTPEEAQRLIALASRETGSLAINILIGFGVVAIAARAVALVPTPLTAVTLGLALTAAGFAVLVSRVKQWDVLGQICLVIGALMFCGGVIAFCEGSLAATTAAIVTALADAGVPMSELPLTPERVWRRIQRLKEEGRWPT